MINYIKKFYTLNKLKNNLKLLSKLNKDLDHNKYNKVLLENIFLKIELIYKYKLNKYWLGLFTNIDEYMLLNDSNNQNKLISILENAQKKYLASKVDIEQILEHINIRAKKYIKVAKIFNCEDASAYRPKNDKTILIRLMDTEHLKLEKESYFSAFPNIKYKNEFYKIIDIYVDDVEEINDNKKAISFSVKMAQDLFEQINEITNENLNQYDLVTHCRLGKSRSTATFIALNEIYNLGYKNLKDIHIHYNRLIYNRLIESSIRNN